MASRGNNVILNAVKPLHDAVSVAVEALTEFELAAAPLLGFMREMSAPEWIARFPPSIVAKVDHIRGLTDNIITDYERIREDVEGVVAHYRRARGVCTSASRCCTEISIS